MKLNFTFSRSLVLLCAGLFFLSPSWGQRQSMLDAALRYVEQHREQWGLTPADISDMVVSDQYRSDHNGVTHVYFIQRYQGIPLHNAIMGIHLKDNGQVGYATSRFLPDLASAVNATEAILTPYQAVQRAAAHLQIPMAGGLRLLSRNDSEHDYLFEGGALADSDIRVRLFYQPLYGTGKARLAWNLAIDQIHTPDYWSIRVDALTGEVIDKNNWTVYCHFPSDRTHAHNSECLIGEKTLAPQFQPVKEALQAQNLTLDGGASYKVFPIPFESPLDGERQLLTDPHDLVASPYGWHDTDGQAGPEYQITRGNNVHAFLDLDDSDASKNDEPNGGENLTFDFPLDLSLEPDDYREAAVTQLFYMINVMHDFAYHYGFDEKAGNFQSNNYSKGGVSNDPVRGNAQDGADLNSNDYRNNANFATPPDGQSGRMQMYLWTRGNNNLLNITEPAEIAGGKEVGTAQFGPAIGSTPVEGKVVNAFDNSSKPSLGCQTIANTAEVAGNIAMVDRGECFFHTKAYRAQQAGAIAVIICNFEEAVIGMAQAAGVPDVTIPTVMLKNSDCQLIRQFIDQGVRIRLQQPDTSGPQFLDGDLDNGVIAHEFGHGISTRLTGGPSQSDCLFNDEQMGEGWSDFFTLITTAKPGDTGNKARGIGNYVIGSPATGTGIRRLPYSTEKTVNNQTYDDVIGTGAPHPLGEVWTGVLWDLYWKFVDVYGYDEDLYTGTGGNNLAIQLIMDGMKLQSCFPGFVDGRNAIIAADYLNYDGIHECLIWEVFAQRGIGWTAAQGESINRDDNVQAFDNNPACIKELQITKTVDKELIEPGTELTYTLTVVNYKDEDATGVIVTDELPANASYVAGSASSLFPFNVQGGFISWDLGNMPPGLEVTLKYKVMTDPGMASQRLYYDDMEDLGLNWDVIALEGTGIWELTTNSAYSGVQSWFAQDSTQENDQILATLDPVTVSGEQPVLRFFHRYDTEPFHDGGIVQVSSDGGSSWDNVDPLIFKHKYRSKIDYSAFAIPNIGGFWGRANQWQPSYVDLSRYLGQDILVRFRFASDSEGANGIENGEGWYVDDFEIMDMVNYDTEACAVSTNGDEACARAAERGTVVDTESATGISELESLGTQVNIFPNPAREEINLTFETTRGGQVEIALLTVDGRMVSRQVRNLHTGFQRLGMNVSELPAGFYFLRLSTQNEVATQKIIIE